MGAQAEKRLARSESADPASRNERRALARMVTRLFEQWDLSAANQAALLGLSTSSRGTLGRYRHGEPLADSRDLIDRVGHLLGIHKSLRILFPHDRDLAYRWVTTPNQRFGGKTPVDVMREEGLTGIALVRRYLDLERGR